MLSYTIPYRLLFDNLATSTLYFNFCIYNFRIQVTIVTVIMVSKTEVINVQEKILLSITEASHLFGIGQHRLREMIREDYGCKYHLTIGRVIKIKRKAFEEYINNVEQI